MDILVLIGAGLLGFFGTLLVLILLVVAQHYITKGKYTRWFLTRATDNHPEIKLPNFLRKLMI